MSVSIYYEAKRAAPLSPVEREKVSELVERFSVNNAIESYIETGQGLNWESFGFYDEPYDPGVILKGSTCLPDNTPAAVWSGIQHWCSALSEIRRAVGNAAWEVQVEDHQLWWDDSKQMYDPTK
jgi:hypothetical protein